MVVGVCGVLCVLPVRLAESEQQMELTVIQQRQQLRGEPECCFGVALKSEGVSGSAAGSERAAYGAGKSTSAAPETGR